MPVAIRPATPDDLDAIVRLKTQLVSGWFEEAATAMDDADYTARLRDRVAELLVNPWYHYVVAVDGERMVGCMSASIIKHLPGPQWSGIDSHMADLYVEPEYRGQRLASGMMDVCMAWARAQGAFRATMHATRVAEPMYRKQGWAEPRIDTSDSPFQSLDYYFQEEE